MMVDRLQIEKAEQILSYFHPMGVAIAIELVKPAIRVNRDCELANALLLCKDQIPEPYRTPEKIRDIANAILVLARREIESDTAEAEAEG